MSIVQSICVSAIFSLGCFVHLHAGSCQSEQKHKNKESPPVIHSQEKLEHSPFLPPNPEESSHTYPTLGIDYLLFKAENTGIVYAYQKIVQQTFGTFTNRMVRGTMINPNYTWKPGFRLGLGWKTPYDLWKLNAQWTYYYNKSVTNRAAPDILLSFIIPNSGEGFYPY